MTVYLAAQRGYFSEVRVTTHPNLAAAEAFRGSYPSEWGTYPVRDDNDPDLGGPGLVAFFNSIARLANRDRIERGEEVIDEVKKFESRGVAKRRIWNLLSTAFEHKPHEEATAAPPRDGDQTQEPASEQENDMAKKAKTKKKAAKPAAERAPRGKGKQAGKVADFRPVREGTDREKVLRLMKGQNTADQIASELGMNAKKVGTIVFCMSRDNGIGYEFGAKGQIKALFPGDNTLRDAIKKAKAE